MKRILFAACSIALAAPATWAAPNGVPGHVRTVGNWVYHDPSEPAPGYEGWSPTDVAGFLQLFPDAMMNTGFDDAKPPGAAPWKQMGRQVSELRAIAAQRGVDLDQRICVSERPDVMLRISEFGTPNCDVRAGGGGCDWEGDMDGSLGEAETVVKEAGRASAGTPDGIFVSTAKWTANHWGHRLLVLRPRAGSEERRRVVSNDATSITIDRPWLTPPRPGDAYEIRGSFDPAWVKRVPSSTHQASLQRFWLNARNVCAPLTTCRGPAEPLDPFAPDNHRGWAESIDRAAYEALRTADTVPALYGFFRDAGTDDRVLEDPYFMARAVVMDVSNPAYRDWRAHYMLYKLRDYGLEPGSAPCVMLSYKPGWHTFYDENRLGPAGTNCSASGTNEWTGPSQVCKNGIGSDGAFNPTPFEAGEFEAGISQFFRDLIAVFNAKGYARARLITQESPEYLGRDWTILASDVRENPKVESQWVGDLDPSRAALASLPPPGSTTPTDSPSATDTPSSNTTTTPVASGVTGGTSTSADSGSGAGTTSGAGTSAGETTTAATGSTGGTSSGSGTTSGSGATSGSGTTSGSVTSAGSVTTTGSVTTSGSSSTPTAPLSASLGTGATHPSTTSSSITPSAPEPRGYVTTSGGSGGGAIYAPDDPRK